jgi:AcrR family transcriptional regulator
VSSPTASRAAHRPSRRDAIVEAAVELFAERPPVEVTIADIADRAGMTSTAVYYHFAAKDQVLLTAVTEFTEDLVAQISELTGPAAAQADPLPTLVDGFLDWVESRRAIATVYFVSSVGSTPDVEALRRETRNRLVPLLARTARRARRVNSGPVSAKDSVRSLALVTLLETAAVADLTVDATYRTLGPRVFRQTLRELAARILDLEAS